ncbi:MAG: RNA-binding S4 domain-containing protein [Pseudomonadota bacterium]
MNNKNGDAEKQRVDVWLFRARFFKTRTLAGKIVQAGGVRLSRNGATERLQKPAQEVRPGDTLVFQTGARTRIIDIVALGPRRGPAREAAGLYEDRSPPPAPREKSFQPSVPARAPGAGRPTKKERRAIDALEKN